jgi:hypothetical protein
MLYATSSNKGCLFLETYSLNEALEQLGEKGYIAAFDEMC